ncbi:MAG: hypothetical protein Kow00107_04880 [Planctomycetota bacterium]
MGEFAKFAVHPARLTEDELMDQCDFNSGRRSGPGGQHRNKVETSVRLRHRPSGVTAEASERRNQGENRKEAVFRLRVNLALEVRANVGEDFHLAPEWNGRVKAMRILINPTHSHFPVLLADTLDLLDACGYDIPTVAERLGCTATQVVKLLCKEPRAFAKVNAERGKLGLRKLESR